MTPEEQKQYELASQMADFEFEQELAAFMGDRGKQAVDADRVRYVDPPQPANIAGRYISPTDALTFSKVGKAAGIVPPEYQAEEDTTVLFGEPGLSKEVQSHEFRHRDNQLLGLQHDEPQHDRVYLMQGFRAGTKGEWEDVVQSFAYYKRIPFEEADTLLREMVREAGPELIALEARAGLESNSAVANRPENEYDQVGLLKAYEQQAEKLYRARQRRN